MLTKVLKYAALAGALGFGHANADCAGPALNSIVTIYYKTAINGRLFDDAVIVRQPTPRDLASIYSQDLDSGIGADVNCKVNGKGLLKNCKFSDLKPATPAARAVLEKIMKLYVVRAPQPKGQIKYVNITMILLRDAQFPGAEAPCIAPFCVTD